MNATEEKSSENEAKNNVLLNHSCGTNRSGDILAQSLRKLLKDAEVISFREL